MLTLSPPIEKAASRDPGISVVLPGVQVVLMQTLSALLLSVNSEMAGSYIPGKCEEFWPQRVATFSSMLLDGLLH